MEDDQDVVIFCDDTLTTIGLLALDDAQWTAEVPKCRFYVSYGLSGKYITHNIELYMVFVMQVADKQLIGINSFSPRIQEHRRRTYYH